MISRIGLLVSLSICAVLLIIFLCVILVYKKRQEQKRIEDEADQPLLEDGADKDDAYSEHVRQLTASELKTADKIRQKYKKANQVTSSGESQDEGSDRLNQSHRSGSGLSNTILHAAKKFQKDASSEYNTGDEFHFNKTQAQIGGAKHIKSSQHEERGEDQKGSETATSATKMKPRQSLIDGQVHSPSTSTPPPPSYLTPVNRPDLHEENSDVGSTTSSRPSSSLASNPPDDDAMVDSSFAANASVYLSVKYLESTDCIIGNIKKLKNVNMNAKNCPKDISFHLKLSPRGKFRMKTPWRVCSTGDLSLTFTIGPVKTRQVIDSSLCVRLYGRTTKNRFARARCYGECMVKLNQLFGIEGNLMLVKKLVSKSSRKNSDDFRFTTDDESEFA